MTNKDKMLAADRKRAKIAYAKGTSDAAIRKQRQTPEYKAADEEFRKYSRLVGNKGPEALAKMFRF